ncbi:MAG: ROK family protein [Candidatus Nomurabacteria bacterium]|nr:MAG: ROK family protein [Candidatus Nomurabacteria bacterium]
MNIVFDIGGTNIRIARVKGTRLDRIEKFSTPSKPQAAFTLMVKHIDALRGEEKVTRIIGGVPGSVDSTRQQLVRAANLTQWKKFALGKKLAQHYSARVQLYNDADLAGLGEAYYGAGKGKEVFAYLTLSTGIGGTRIVKGKIDQASGTFEPGHHVIDAATVLRKGPRSEGYWEKFVSGSALQRRFHNPAEKIHDAKVWQEFHAYIALGLVNVSIFWSPEAIVLGGALMQNTHVSISRLQKLLQKYYYISSPTPKLIRGKLGDRAGLYGAMSLLRHI